MSFEPGNRLIAALDVATREEADRLVARLAGASDWLKVGLELFIAAGPALVRDHAASGRRLMLDLKLHDIPATVERAAARAAELGAGLLTVHAAGGRAMIEAAASAVARAGGGDAGRTRILAVTVLTSLDQRDLAEVGEDVPLAELVVRRARLAIDAGADGVVASPREAAVVRQIAPPGFLIVTPGVRSGAAAVGDDQKRVATAGEARAAGADLVVVGRPIRDAADPAAAARAIAAELAAAG